MVWKEGKRSKLGPEAHHKLLMELRGLRGTRTFCLHVNFNHVVLQFNASPMEKGIASLLSWRRQGPGKSLPAPFSLADALPQPVGSCGESETCRAPSTSTRMCLHPSTSTAPAASAHLFICQTSTKTMTLRTLSPLQMTSLWPTSSSPSDEGDVRISRMEHPVLCGQVKDFLTYRHGSLLSVPSGKFRKDSEVCIHL